MTPRRPSPVPPLLAFGALILDTTTRLLSGPGGAQQLSGAPYVLTRELFLQPGATVSQVALIAALWPTPDLEPKDTERAVRMSVFRVRQALEKVGVSPSRLRCTWGDGYALDGEPRVVRSYTPDQAAALDRLISTHPDAALAATVAPEMAA